MRSLSPGLVCVFALLSAISPLVASFSLGGGGRSKQQRLGGGVGTAGTKEPVPGDNPLSYCEGAAESEFLVIEHVDLVPNPPKPGHNLTIEAAGVVKKDIKEGAYVELVVKYGFIQLIQTTVDLCEQIRSIGLDCPIKAGETTITKSVALPQEIPPGKYTVKADVYSSDAEPVTCLDAEVHFNLL